ncbi:hypothetical protein TSUD_379320, partial [Trifolium subterraneum]
MIRSLAVYSSRIAVGVHCNGILFFSYNEDGKKLTLHSGNSSARSVTDYILMDDSTVSVSNFKTIITVLSSDHLNGSISSTNLRLICAYYMGEIVWSIRKCSFSYKLPADDALLGEIAPETSVGSLQNAIVASTLLGSIIIFLPLS